MAGWTDANGDIVDLTVYHGTTDTAVPGWTGKVGDVVTSFTIDLSKSSPRTDFGRGFYVTTSVAQSSKWANIRAVSNGGNAMVLKFEIDREWLAIRQTLVFTRASAEFWYLLRDCRGGKSPHQRKGKGPFDVVYAPVSQWPKREIFINYDQISFHSDDAGRALGQPVMHSIGYPHII